MISRAGVLQQLPQAFIQIQLARRKVEPRALCLPGIDLLVQSKCRGTVDISSLQFQFHYGRSRRFVITYENPSPSE